MEHAPTLFEVLPAVVAGVDSRILIGFQTLVVCIVLVLLVAWRVRRELAKGDPLVPPEGLTLRSIVDLMFEGVAGLMRDTIGPTWPRYVPLVGTIGIFILVANLMRQLPGFDGPTGYVETNLAWAAMAFAVAEYVAIESQGGWTYLKHLMGPVVPLWPLILLVEIFSHLARMLSLTVRLTGNMFADHTLIAVFLAMGYIGVFVPWVFMGLGLFVALLQAFIFTFLTIIYIGQALEEAH